MKKILISICLLLCGMTLQAQQQPALIPYPQELTMTGGKLPIDKDLKNDISIALSAQGNRGKVNIINDKTLPKEGYRLSITTQGITITYGTPNGLLYAFNTLQQLTQTSTDKTLPTLEIYDYPQFEHRGFMLDVSRHFFNKEEVKKLLDIMAYYKLNRFHWHLTDDQGWRIEIPEYPKLTKIGAVRDSSLTNKGSKPFFYDDTPYGEGCYYTLKDLKEVVKYAQSLGIEIIPEIDLPGHMVAAVASYPELGCNPDRQVKVRVHQGVSKEVLNVGDDRVIDFLKCVLGHVAEVFPYKYIHLGGDECPTDEWKTNPLALNRVKEQGLKGVEELQSWLVEELGTYLKEEYNKDLVVWDELLAHWNDDNKIRPVIMCWRGLKYTNEAGRRGFKCISVPNYHNYLDLIQVEADKADINEVYQGGYGPKDVNTVEHIYSLNPVSQMQGNEQHCLGTQVNLWTESCKNNEQAEYQVLPRLLSLAETAWLPAKKKNWNNFYTRLQSHDEILGALGYTYAKHYFEPTPKTDAEKALDEGIKLQRDGKPNAVGYPSIKAYQTLSEDLTHNKAISGINTFKKQNITMPKNGNTYKIISASTYYLAKYAGSTVYAKAGEGLHLHYTPQNTKSELWHCKKINKNTFTFTNAEDPNVVIGPVTISKPTEPAAQYDYVSGTLLMQRDDGLFLNANSSGCVTWGTEQKVCFPGTWRLVEK